MNNIKKNRIKSGCDSMKKLVFNFLSSSDALNRNLDYCWVITKHRVNTDLKIMYQVPYIKKFAKGQTEVSILEWYRQQTQQAICVSSAFCKQAANNRARLCGRICWPLPCLRRADPADLRRTSSRCQGVGLLKEV